MKLFLQGHGLLQEILDAQTEKYFFPLISEELFLESQKIASVLRLEGKKVSLGLSEKKLAKALKYADKNKYSHMVIFGEDEKTKGEFVVKNLRNGEERREVL